MPKEKKKKTEFKVVSGLVGEPDFLEQLALATQEGWELITICINNGTQIGYLKK